MYVLNKLPEDTIRNIMSFCEIPILFSLRATNKWFLNLPNAHNKESYIETSIMLSKFLKHVGYGEQDQAEAILKVNRNLALEFGDLIDCSGRICKQVTGLQYAVWVLDWHMWTMLQKYMSIEVVREQLTTLNREGIDVKEPGGNTYTRTTQISWQNLIHALQELETNWDRWDSNTQDTHWRQQVGGAQLLLPAHVINEYSRLDKSFYPCPQFNDIQLPRIGVDVWYANKEQTEVLGKTFAWVKLMKQLPCLRMSQCEWGCWIGITAINCLYNTRVEQRAQLISSVNRNRIRLSCIIL